MFSNKIKRCLLLVMALAAMLSLLTFQIFAAESDTQAEIDRILNDYLGTTTMSPEDISAAVAEMDWETYQTARWEISELENSLVASMERGELTEAEAQQLIDRNTVLCNFSDALEVKAAKDTDTSIFAAKKNTVLDGQVSVTDSSGNGSLSNGIVTIQAKGSLFSKATNTVTITNETANTATLAFDYTASTYNRFTIAGASASASGTYSGLLDAGASVTVIIQSNSGFSSTTATLKLSNFSLTAAAASSNVTINFDSALGSVTVGGTAIASGATQEVSLTDGVALVAAASNGGRFLGWINGSDNSILSTATSYALNPASDMTVEAVFVGANSEPWFMVGGATQKSESVGLLGMSKLYYYTVSGSHLFNDLNDAATAAYNHPNYKTVVLMNDGTLSAGTYTIPAGVTLLIPFDDANTLYTTQAQAEGTYKTPTAYRTLTLADGANLVINGAMSLSAKTRYGQGAKLDGGSPTGNVSFVRMQGNSNITVNNDGALYAYGFITGSGSVTANSGATIYECFQFMDCRGGTQMTDMDNGVFPMSQYYVQNIEVPLTFYAGAMEYAFTTVYMQSTEFPTAVLFVASSDSLFKLTDGYVIKKYDGRTDRLIMELYGTVDLSNFELKVSAATIRSKDYDLAINSNITVKVKSGSKAAIAQDLALLPGSVVEIEEGATCTLGSGNSLYIYDADEWGNYCYSGSNKKFAALTYAPGRTYTRTEADLVDATILVNGTVDASDGYVYTTAGGANIYSTGTGGVKTTAGTQTVTYQLVQGTGYTEIPITPVKLKHGNGTYLTSGTNTYVYNNKTDRWECSTEHSGTGHTPGGAPTCTTAQTCTVCGATVTPAKGHTEVTDAMVPPTFDATGLTAGSHCSVCSEVFTAQEEIPVLSGMSVNIAVNDSLDIHFYLTKEVISQIQKYYPDMQINAKITRTYGDGTQAEETTYSLENWKSVTNNNEEAKRFSYTNIAAKEMTDTMTVVIFAGDKVLKTLENYSVKAYAMKVLQNTSGQSELTTALVDMLNYGAAAQSHFGYNQSTLANADLTVEQQGYATESVTHEDKYSSGSQAAAASVSAKNNLMYTFYFDLSGYTEDQRSGAKAAISYSHYTNSAVSENVEFASFYKFNDRLYGVDVKGMYIADGRQKVTCTLSIGGDILTATDSIEGYIARATSGNDVYMMLMKFIDSAYKYFS